MHVWPESGQPVCDRDQVRRQDLGLWVLSEGLSHRLSGPLAKYAMQKRSPKKKRQHKHAQGT